jgi:hypothetical protein
MSKRLIPSNIEELKSIHKAATEAGTKFNAKLKVLNLKVTAKKVEINKLLEQIDPAVRKASQTHYDNEFSAFQKELRKVSDAERWEVLRDLQGLYESTAYARENLGDPRKLATAHGLGEEKRSRLEASLASMGSAALASLAKKAEVTGDKDLAAALVAINDTLPAKERPFSSQGIAEKLFGEEAAQARDLAKEINHGLQAAMTVNREFEGTKISAFQKLSNGINFDGQLVPSDKPAPVTGKRSSTQLISDGLAAL